MKIYLVILEDRHIDIQVEVFYSSEEAVKRAKILANEYCKYEEAYEEEDIAGWLFYAVYSYEGDCVHVEESKIY